MGVKNTFWDTTPKTQIDSIIDAIRDLSSKMVDAQSLLNLIKNGNFKDGLANWVATSEWVVDTGTHYVGEQCASVSSGQWLHLYQVVSVKPGHKYYISGYGKSSTGAVPNNAFGWVDGTTFSNYPTGEGFGSTEFRQRDFIITPTQSKIAIGYAVYVPTVETFWADAVLCIDLTAIFGAGREPTIEEVRHIIDTYADGWFDGQIFLNLQQDNEPVKMVELTETGVGVSGYNGAIFSISKNWFSLHIEASYDFGETFVPLRVVKKDTGTEYIRVDVSGEYVVNIQGATHLRYVKDGQHTVATIKTILTTDALPPVTSKFAGKKLYYPKGQKLLTTRHLGSELGSARRLLDVDLNTGTLYIGGNKRLQKSNDYGETFETIAEMDMVGGWLENAKKLSNGSVLVFAVDSSTNETKVFLSDENEENFTLVDEYPYEGSILNKWGLSVYGDIIVYAPYVQKPVPIPIPVRLSRDGGETWEIIFESENDNPDWHIHDVVYDPYRSLIWVCHGDGAVNAGVIYTPDWGKTWKTLPKYGQSTTIHPMPDMILFGADQDRFGGIHRLLVSPTETLNQHLVSQSMEVAWAQTPADEWYDATTRGSQFWDADAVYFGVYLRASLYGTKDGVMFYNIMDINKEGVSRIDSVFGVDVNGNLVCGINDPYNIAIIKAPEWEQL